MSVENHNGPNKPVPPLIAKIWAVVTARGDVLSGHLTYHAAFLLAKDSKHTFVVGQQSVDRARQTKESNMTPIQIAEIAHEVNRAYCEALGDTSQLPWAEAPDWQKTSALNGVNFHLNNPTAGPDHSHNEWLKEKEATGWKYGPAKDVDKKEHPCFMPYDQLPVEQKAKDYIFRGVVHALARYLTSNE